jgi:HSP20 family protein
MAVVRWNPWNDLFELHSQMDQLFQSMGGAETMSTQNGDTQYASLPIDVRQTNEAFLLEASVPGFSPEDVEVTFDDGVLTIKGTHKTEREEGKGQWVRRERRLSSVFRQVGLPAEVRADEISASFENGVLRITVPRAQKAQPKRIQVTAGAGQSGEPKVIEHHSS